ncbi:uncharacterized protein LTR77_005996 [Saxophila tyrrhenica]|uniref:Zn(2)-C6 fungal-type domain-containing protein n=1 Tax=Saxophila tyrrhenica TaxID=1690608 RepID=A0AAV9P787_9PEZI|nr:hypothetical protein LTR77_005996 [Saxophila tyrrhenica]
MDAGLVSDTQPSDSELSEMRPPLKRARSSYEKNGQVKNVDSGSEEANLRALSDPLDYPRRRATIACEICRSRKSRCDGARPKCRLCSELNADCVYREPGIKLDAGDKLILEQLSRIEVLLQSNMTTPTSGGGLLAGPISPATSNTASTGTEEHGGGLKRLSTTSAGPQSAQPLPLNGFGTWSANISTMPKSHTTPALHLLQWPVIKDLISRPCDPQVLMQLEMSRPPLDFGIHYSLDLSNVTPYVHAFFDHVNGWYAVVDPNVWHTHYRTAMSQGFRTGPESCICLLVLALGQAAHYGQSISRVPQGQLAPGMSYFAAAWTLLPNLITRNDILSAQCHILAAAYMMYLVRPLEAWNLLYNSSMKLQLLLSSAENIPAPHKELSERVYWNALMIESDLLAELDLPHSGVVQFEESMRLPRSFPYDPASSNGTDSPPGNDDLWYFLAEIALRRLLNRVSHLIYSYTHRASNSFSIAALEPVVAELDYQLNQWYESLPLPVKFPRERVPAATQIQTVLRLRYYACRTIIFRPYIQAVLADENVASEPGVQEACSKCLDACIRQLEYLPEHHQGHLPYLWQGALSIMSQSLLVMSATVNQTLAALMPGKREMDAVIAEVVGELERLAHLAPSIRLCAEMVREAEERRHGMIERRGMGMR